MGSDNQACFLQGELQGSNGNPRDPKQPQIKNEDTAPVSAAHTQQYRQTSGSNFLKPANRRAVYPNQVSAYEHQPPSRPNQSISNRMPPPAQTAVPTPPAPRSSNEAPSKAELAKAPVPEPVPQTKDNSRIREALSRLFMKIQGRKSDYLDWKRAFETEGYTLEWIYRKPEEHGDDSYLAVQDMGSAGLLAAVTKDGASFIIPTCNITTASLSDTGMCFWYDIHTSAIVFRSLKPAEANRDGNRYICVKKGVIQ